MSTTTKIILLLILILRLLGSGVGFGDTGYNGVFALLSELAFIVLIIHLLYELKFSFVIYSILLALVLIGEIGVFFRIMHWSLNGPMSMLGLIGGIGMGVVLIWSSLKSGKTLLFHLIVGLCILAQILIPLVLKSFDTSWYLSLLNYPIAALACTILLNQQDKNKGERDVLIVVALQAVLFIIKHTLTLL